MRSVRSEREISAGPDIVWSVLTDAPLLVAAGIGILDLKGTIAPRALLRLRSDVAPGRVFVLRVTGFEPGRRMVWQGGIPFGLFTGRRAFDLSPTAKGTCLEIHETFSGPLAGAIWKTMPDLQPSFERFADGIKRLSEGDTP